jgi:hypothetical protein
MSRYFPRGMHGQKRHQPPNLRSQESGTEDSELKSTLGGEREREIEDLILKLID